ncbi:MAG: hypothetical protein ACRYFB_03110 [Janthinobacterium lividum]
MENEDFDENLKNRIKQIFEDYDDGAADKGWNLLREKYPEKKRRNYIFWWTCAAVTLLLMALIIWFFQAETCKAKFAKTIKLKPDTAKIQAKVYSSSEKSIIKTDSRDTNHVEKTVLKTVSDFAFIPRSTQQKTLIIRPKDTVINQVNEHNNTAFTDIKLVSTDSANQSIQAFDFAKIDSLHHEKLQSIGQTQSPGVKPVSKKEPIKTASIKKPTQKTSKLSLSIYAGPHINFANGSKNQLGFGAGISTDFQLSKKLKLSSGLSVIQNKLYYQNNFSNNSLLAASPANLSIYSSQGIISSTVLNSLNASLIQLDIPINLIYNILPGKNSISALAGVSSGTFAKESYQYNYANSANDFQNSKSFKSFYMLKTLNVAAQFRLPLKNYNLQVEPFLKVPLGNLTTQQLKFNATGINLRFNFQPSKK